MFNVAHRPLTSQYAAGMFALSEVHQLADRPDPVAGVTERHYASLEALVDNGWRVD